MRTKNTTHQLNGINMNNFDPQKYEKLIENSTDKILQSHMAAEKESINKIFKYSNATTAVDLGSGYGRLIPHLAFLFHRVIAVELDLKMSSELQKRFDNADDIHIVQDNMIRYLNNSPHEESCLYLIAQNTLGTIDGSKTDVLDAIGRKLINKKSHAVISLFKSSALPTWGSKFYNDIAEMSGPFGNIDTENSVYKSQSGYISHWFTDDEINSMERNLKRAVYEKVESTEWIVLTF